MNYINTMMNFADMSGEYLGKLTFSLSVLIVIALISRFLKFLINQVFQSVKRTKISAHVISKTRTLRALLYNILDVVVFLIGLLIVLSHWGVDVRPILAGAGVVGLAISFGSQTLIKDLLSGFFIIIEDQFNIGDEVKIGEHRGYVHQVTLRLTVLRDKEGNLIYIPNSQILNVVRFTTSEQV